MRLWSPASLRNGVDDWKQITPEPLHKAVEALRREFATNTWKAGEIMRQGCHPALHRGMAEQARMINEGLKKLGLPALPSVDGGETEPSVFVAYFEQSVGLIAHEVKKTFSELLAISFAQSPLIGRDPVEWATLETKLMIAHESHRIPLWTKDTSDVQPHDPNDTEESIYWTKWRAPRWFFMQPFATRPYDRSTAWERMDEAESKHLLEVVEDRFNQRLIMALEKVVDETHVRLAKQSRESTRTATPAVTQPALQVPAESAAKGADVNGLRSEADLWRDFHEKFQSLAGEEREQGAAQRDRFVKAYFTYRKGTEILQVQRDAQWAFGLFGNSEKLPDPPNVLTSIPAHGPFCLIQTPKYGLWTLSDGVNESVQERFQTLAARAGIALDCPQGTDPVDFWLHRLVLDLRENKSKLLFADSGEAGMIPRACEASAVFCSRLERKALERTPRREELSRFAPRMTESPQGATSVPQVQINELANKRKALVEPILDEKGWSIHQLAVEAQLDFHTVNDYLKGKTRPNRSTRKQLAEALGIRVENLPQ